MSLRDALLREKSRRPSPRSSAVSSPARYDGKARHQRQCSLSCAANRSSLTQTELIVTAQSLAAVRIRARKGGGRRTLRPLRGLSVRAGTSSRATRSPVGQAARAACAAEGRLAPVAQPRAEALPRTPRLTANFRPVRADRSTARSSRTCVQEYERCYSEMQRPPRMPRYGRLLRQEDCAGQQNYELVQSAIGVPWRLRRRDPCDGVRFQFFLPFAQWRPADRADLSRAKGSAGRMDRRPSPGCRARSMRCSCASSNEVTDWSVPHLLYLLESYNGFGYRRTAYRRHIYGVSPTSTRRVSSRRTGSSIQTRSADNVAPR